MPATARISNDTLLVGRGRRDRLLVTGGMGASGEKWPCASAAGNVKAGNDIPMPGIPSDKIDILAWKNQDALHGAQRARAAVSKASTGDDFEAGVRQQTRR